MIIQNNKKKKPVVIRHTEAASSLGTPVYRPTQHHTCDPSQWGSVRSHRPTPIEYCLPL